MLKPESQVEALLELLLEPVGREERRNILGALRKANR
jgi:hypothetical protein